MQDKVTVDVRRPVPNNWCMDKFVGFTKLDEIEWDSEPDQFNITGIWRRDSDGTIWTADDSGCSCPTPWEDTTTLERLFNMDELIERYRKSNAGASAWESFKATVEQALAALKG